MLKRLKRIKKEEKKSTGWWDTFLPNIVLISSFLGVFQILTSAEQQRDTRPWEIVISCSSYYPAFTYEILITKDCSYAQYSEIPCSETLGVLNTLTLQFYKLGPLYFPEHKTTSTTCPPPQLVSMSGNSDIFKEFDFHWYDTFGILEPVLVPWSINCLIVTDFFLKSETEKANCHSSVLRRSSIIFLHGQM